MIYKGVDKIAGAASGTSGTFFTNGWEPPVSGLTVTDAETLITALDGQIDHHEIQATMGSWWLADVLVWCEDNLGDAFSQVTPDPSKNRKSYLALMRIARDFADRSRRYPPEVVKIWKHGEVYNLEPYVQDELLEAFAEGELNGTELRKEAQKLRDEQNENSKDKAKVHLQRAVELLHALHSGTAIELEGEKWRVVGVHVTTHYQLGWPDQETGQRELVGADINHDISLCGDSDTQLEATGGIDWQGNLVITEKSWGMT